MDDPLLTVNLHNLALAALVGPSDNLHLVVSTNRDGAGVVLFAELLGEVCRHDLATHAGGSREVSLAALAAGGRDVDAELHCCGLRGYFRIRRES